MPKKSKRYSYQFPTATFWIIFGLVFVVLWLWLALKQSGQGASGIKAAGSTVGVIGYLFFSLSLFLASRMKILENWFGGLDQIYRLHHRLGLLGFYFLLAHPLIHAFKWFSRPKFFWFVFPFHHRLSVNLGSLAFWLMVVIIGITILKLLPYDKWKILHKFMALVFVLSSLHFLLSHRRFGHTSESLALLFIPMGLGLLGIVYKQIYLPFFCKLPAYVVTEVSTITDNVVMVSFKPEDKPLRFIPGQYAFFSFEGGEQHPFTVCRFRDSTVSILAKARGDFTRMLYETVKPGMRASLEGPYGRFDYRKGGRDQIWIAGGVGIVPFLAWNESLAKWPGRCILYYCVHRNEDTVFAKDLGKMKEGNPNFDFHLFCTEKKERLTIETIVQNEGALEKKEIFMCGPRRLTHAFAKELAQAGVKRWNIHFEDFEFF